ncbi:hypothetical protein [Cryptosporangium arvum]|uniref:Uncharacterized protein n=1 Tax=Cryptosporangium arvum DSM 44712 TaxID=927661 RepID=A0A010ZKG2_9ACTN|nr:hypothetical protein [Cryptosporangium arvum]EXG79139.1 hypothetical protein CryarDRAFT_0162 [Cryptosporangium arvum DSM 44712]
MTSAQQSWDSSGAWDPAPQRQPPGYVPQPAPPPVPRRPRFRESGPVRWWGVLIGVCVSLVYYVLVGLVSWSTTSLIGLFLAAVLLGGSAGTVLITRGDRGMGVGVAAVSGAALSVAITVLAWNTFNLDQAFI